MGALHGICGSANDIDPLELGLLNLDYMEGSPKYTLKPLYDAICRVLLLKEEEKSIFSLDLYCQVSAMVARNGFEICTKSPFSAYYSAVVHAVGSWGSVRHSQIVEEVAAALGASDGKLQRRMDIELDDKIHMREHTSYHQGVVLNSIGRHEPPAL